MASDDNESTEKPRAPQEPLAPSSLPPHVERALAEARVSAASAGTRSAAAGTAGARWLALIPVTVAILTFLLMMPRAAPPEDLPLPDIDGKALAAVRQDDIDRAAAARGTRLSSDILLVGTNLRALNKARMENLGEEEIGVARIALESAFVTAAAEGEPSADALRTLRATQLEAFLVEVERFDATGKPSEELEELAGPFIDHMAGAGWVEGGKVVLDDAARRAAFKLVWNTQVGAHRLPSLGLTLDEERALYTFYLRHPHAAEPQRLAYESMRKNATNGPDCQKAIAEEKLDMEFWRIEKIRHLAEIDPTYPAAYALGVAYYRAGRYEQSIESFRAWILKHPDGPLTLRARNHMKAAVFAFGS